ncbi:EamA family transporter RarD [Domibacillus sp. DTU_2020_1001157_1_SI_ALB_TIR_016]|uniref:EamA family transporter RarD n=1 Tax=Domibacillus sp. DTU_2020_1001157_1_SI_ALB_TIR_016 TaxID=3077789 RepID=UPI0028E66857|nr:EamA family transporter RarD [Domibacillus sp. DTU_2020_1001157_1_SI_ALB_TIR_016]WNS81724.1 EamA family transporter RarD [Domibacillus sp. DTU_2020_1001157_1_SI_ALB_TIR_016]
MQDERKAGMIYTAGSYVIWGLIPIYWKLVSGVSAYEILANRVIWSFVFMILLLVLMRKLAPLGQVLKEITTHPKKAAALATASVLVSINWFVFIWAVNNNHIIETSMGYYINPLMSVLLGILVLKEALSKAQILSFILAGCGVLIMTFSYGSFPWVSISLAVSFALYGLAKKMIRMDAAVGLTIETAVVTPIAVLYLIFLSSNGTLQLFSGSVQTDLLLIGGGVLTAVPLLLFGHGAQKIPLYLIGFLQYIAPTMTLLLGVFLYHEPFTPSQLLSFSFIWSALVVFTFAQLKTVQKKKAVI